MPCSYTRLDVSRIVLDVIRHIQHDQSIVEASVFGPQGINVDAQFRSTYFFPIKLSIEKVDCLIKNFSPADCENAGTVGDIVDAVFRDFQTQAASAQALGMVAPQAAVVQPRKARKARKPAKARKPGKTRKAKTKKR